MFPFSSVAEILIIYKQVYKGLSAGLQDTFPSIWWEQVVGRQDSRPNAQRLRQYKTCLRQLRNTANPFSQVKLVLFFLLLNATIPCYNRRPSSNLSLIKIRHLSKSPNWAENIERRLICYPNVLVGTNCGWSTWRSVSSMESSNSSSNVKMTGSSMGKPRRRRQGPVTLTNLAQRNYWAGRWKYIKENWKNIYFYKSLREEQRLLNSRR